MQLTSNSFEDGSSIPAQFAFAKAAPQDHVTLSDNRSPHLAWSDVPEGCKSLALICVDVDAPTVGDDVNQEGKSVAADLPRANFYHWSMLDIAPDVTELAAGACSDEVTPGGKQDPAGPAGTRQGINDYTSWFESDPDMGGTYKGYDGPAPPWNDERVHHYHFRIYALDVDRCAVEADFGCRDVETAIQGHVLAEAEIVGSYTQNPALL